MCEQKCFKLGSFESEVPVISGFAICFLVNVYTLRSKPSYVIRVMSAINESEFVAVKMMNTCILRKKDIFKFTVVIDVNRSFKATLFLRFQLAK